MFAPEEVFFITTIFLHNKEHTIKIVPNVSDEATTFTCMAR